MKILNVRGVFNETLTLYPRAAAPEMFYRRSTFAGLSDAELMRSKYIKCTTSDDGAVFMKLFIVSVLVEELVVRMDCSPPDGQCWSCVWIIDFTNGRAIDARHPTGSRSGVSDLCKANGWSLDCILEIMSEPQNVMRQLRMVRVCFWRVEVNENHQMILTKATIIILIMMNIETAETPRSEIF